jgi:arylsulfatase A
METMRDLPLMHALIRAIPAFGLAVLMQALLPLFIMAERPPNFLLIVVDDLGFGDIVALRGDRPWTNAVPVPEGVSPPRTPHLDALAASGRVLTDFYSNASLCSPTRAALLTARYQQRSGVSSVLGQLGRALDRVGKGDVFDGWAAREVVLVQHLRESGYRTAMFGKVHLPGHPLDMGFDTYVGSHSGAGDNFAMVDARGNSTFFRNRTRVSAPGYWYTDVLADEAIEYIRQPDDRQSPFFVYLAFTAPHTPLFGPNDKELSDTWDRVDTIGYGPREDHHQAYVDVVEGLDAAIGRIVAALAQDGLLEETLIFFTSDNGPIDVGSPEPFIGRKSRVDEGGIRVPTIVSWKDRIEEGTRSAFPALTMDIIPTFYALAQIDLPQDRAIDGINISEAFFLSDADTTFPDRLLFWEQPRGVHIASYADKLFAVRKQNWKLRYSTDRQLKLFDLFNDPREENDVLADYPELAQQLNNAYQSWREQVIADAPFDEKEFIKLLETHGLSQHRGLLMD